MILQILTILTILQISMGKDIKGCKKYNEDNSCTQCYLGYQIVKFKPNPDSSVEETTCRKCNFGCLECSGDNTNVCTRCYNGFYLESHSKVCHKCDVSCARCSENNTNCEECMQGYYDTRKVPASSGAKPKENETTEPTEPILMPKCNKCMSNCDFCTERAVCKTCVKGFPMSEDGSMCINFHHNNEKFAIVYTFTALFGVIVILVSCCYMTCNCCTF